ncbi:expressed unknown protein [Seminavis robusta]|uniref:Uncharacterized protein n=1 Tax=Seminavis robusta TaxID=568900 RepID=A0A9N8HVG8_9STRA|nr:expressed unknown protein [Seminavis robusta]|eukprot:Sro1803_g298600.1 n/a (129) ;mRNA; r:5186-5832
MMRILFLSMLLAVLIAMASAASHQDEPGRVLRTPASHQPKHEIRKLDESGESGDEGGEGGDSGDSGDSGDDDDESDCFDTCWGDATDDEIDAWTEDQWIEWGTCADTACDCTDDECAADADCSEATCT